MLRETAPVPVPARSRAFGRPSAGRSVCADPDDRTRARIADQQPPGLRLPRAFDKPVSGLPALFLGRRLFSRKHIVFVVMQKVISPRS